MLGRVGRQAHIITRYGRQAGLQREHEYGVNLVAYTLTGGETPITRREAMS